MSVQPTTVDNLATVILFNRLLPLVGAGAGAVAVPGLTEDER
jgi:hypothetical protein